MARESGPSSTPQPCGDGKAVPPPGSCGYWVARSSRAMTTEGHCHYSDGMNFSAGNQVPSRVGGQGTDITWSNTT
jgi:hypothetical protein